MFEATLFVIVEIWKQPRSPSIGRWMCKVRNEEQVKSVFSGRPYQGYEQRRKNGAREFADSLPQLQCRKE